MQICFTSNQVFSRYADAIPWQSKRGDKVDKALGTTFVRCYRKTQADLVTEFENSKL